MSVEALQGLIPLEQKYQNTNSGKEEYWQNRIEYLKRTQKIMWNKDYMLFLIKDVWKILEPEQENSEEILDSIIKAEHWDDNFLWLELREK